MGRSPIPPCCKLPPPSRTNPTELPPALDEHSEQSEPNSHPSSDTLSRIALELEYKAWLRVPETQGTDVTGSTDLLAWWKMNKIQFPTISKFKQKISCNTCIIYPIRTSVFKGVVNSRSSEMKSLAGIVCHAQAQCLGTSLIIWLDTVNCIQILIALVCSINYGICV